MIWQGHTKGWKHTSQSSNKNINVEHKNVLSKGDAVKTLLIVSGCPLPKGSFESINTKNTIQERLKGITWEKDTMRQKNIY